MLLFTISKNAIFSEVWKATSIAVILSLELQECTRNGEEGYTAVPPEQSFENCQFDTALIEEGMYWISYITLSISCLIQTLHVSFCCLKILRFILSTFIIFCFDSSTSYRSKKKCFRWWWRETSRIILWW